MAGSKVSAVYAANSIEEQKASYDAWASDYETELCAMGYRIPAVIASVFTRFVSTEQQPILDAGCGGGIQAEPLALLGYGPITGIDLSDGMLEVARSKNIYAELHQMALKDHLDLPDNHFAAIISSGVITPNHAPPSSFEGLIRVAAPGAPIVFSLRNDAGQEPEYPAALARLADQGKWTHVFTTDGFHSMPYGEPDVTHQVHVYKVS